MIRIAVNLLLIVALVLQPLAVLGHAAGDVQCHGIDSQSVRLGCNCCQGTETEQNCCCCGSVESHLDTSHQQSPSGGTPVRAKRSASISVCLCGDQQQPMSGRTATTAELQAQTDSVLQSLESYCASDGFIPPTSQSSSTIVRSPHFAQQCLSVWLI